MSDRGIPASYRHMQGICNHSFSLINSTGEHHWVKFHLKCQQGIKNLSDAEAEALIGQDRESHQHDLYNAIGQGNFPGWTMATQVMPEADVKRSPTITLISLKYGPIVIIP